MKKIAIYCRVSTEEQDADKQEYICKRYCEVNDDFEVYKISDDNDEPEHPWEKTLKAFNH